MALEPDFAQISSFKVFVKTFMKIHQFRLFWNCSTLMLTSGGVGCLSDPNEKIIVKDQTFF